MNSLLFLSEQDFSIQQGKKGRILCNNLPGVSLVLFFSKQCDHCVDVFPVFASLPHGIPGCQFAILNISMFPGVAQKAQQTIAPITHVPFIILYVNGRPFMRFNGRKTYEDISTFVNEVLSRIQSKRNFSSSPSQLNVEDNDIPEYASGIPFNILCEGENCYLTFNEAYKK
ncbi:MAG: thioredoxin family protein [Candidatus Colwellbacteria bacterium]|nr:thioredoxin family protein [Candidatus Colwellbacteria bacterium]